MALIRLILLVFVLIFWVDFNIVLINICLFSIKKVYIYYFFVIYCYSARCYFCFFLYEKRPVSLRWTSCFSTSLSFLVSNILHFFFFFLILPSSYVRFSFFPLPFFSFFVFFLSHAYTHALIYYNVSLFSFVFLPFIFYVLQPLCLSAYYDKISFLFKNNSWYVLCIL